MADVEELEELERLYDMPTVAEPIVISKEEEKLEDVCEGTAETPSCSNPAVLKVVWQECLCGKRICLYCIRCYENFSMGPAGKRMARCLNCNCNIYMLSVGGIK